MANNTIDYWMKKDNDNVTYEQVIGAIKNYVWHNNSNLQIYLHVPYCTQKCTFCAFSGGNSRDFKTVERYSKLLVWQMGELLKLSPAYGKEIRSVNIGGGSPDLLRQYIGYVLRAVRDLPGCTDSTEISVELALPTVTDEFIRELLEYNVTKASFGVQVIDPKIRRYLGMPSRMLNLDEVCGKLAQNIPIINVDLLTGIPGQTIASVIEDLQFFINHQHVNSISTYALIPGAAPKLISDIKSKKIPPQPPQTEQALFRLHSYATLLRNGWIRKGTNSYMDPKRIPEDKLNILAGNESIGTQRYEDFLVGAGAQAIFYIPGARIEHTVDVNTWMDTIEKGIHSFALEKCSLDHQKDMALWIFPLRANGLLISEYQAMLSEGVLDQEQINNFNAFMDEALIIKAGEWYQLSIVGEVFMGHLVRNLKRREDRSVVDDYIQDGYILGDLLTEEKIAFENSINNRQIFKRFVEDLA